MLPSQPGNGLVPRPAHLPALVLGGAKVAMQQSRALPRTWTGTPTMQPTAQPRRSSMGSTATRAGEYFVHIYSPGAPSTTAVSAIVALRRLARAVRWSASDSSPRLVCRRRLRRRHRCPFLARSTSSRPDTRLALAVASRAACFLTRPSTWAVGLRRRQAFTQASTVIVDRNTAAVEPNSFPASRDTAEERHGTTLSSTPRPPAIMAAGLPPPSPSRSRSRRSRGHRDDDIRTARRAATLPAPTTYNEYKVNRPRDGGERKSKSRFLSVKPAGEWPSRLSSLALYPHRLPVGQQGQCRLQCPLARRPGRSGREM
ncbi:hypothetical protein ACCO45_010832 [Purpureocillium lilacinum]|uniref:Uncharacterized protein n=1 Tax=Purpureocillium lilacinum TaxID=33203 RepID=A0ACC4DHB9_PURLI